MTVSYWPWRIFCNNDQQFHRERTVDHSTAQVYTTMENDSQVRASDCHRALFRKKLKNYQLTIMDRRVREDIKLFIGAKAALKLYIDLFATTPS